MADYQHVVKLEHLLDISMRLCTCETLDQLKAAVTADELALYVEELAKIDPDGPSQMAEHFGYPVIEALQYELRPDPSLLRRL